MDGRADRSCSNCVPPGHAEPLSRNPHPRRGLPSIVPETAATSNSGDAKVIRKFGDVPDDLSPL